MEEERRGDLRDAWLAASRDAMTMSTAARRTSRAGTAIPIACGGGGRKWNRALGMITVRSQYMYGIIMYATRRLGGLTELASHFITAKDASFMATEYCLVDLVDGKLVQTVLSRKLGLFRFLGTH